MNISLMLVKGGGQEAAERESGHNTEGECKDGVRPGHQ